MIKQTITYTDFDGNEVTEDLHFHVSKTDLTDNLQLKDELQDVMTMVGGEKKDLSVEEMQKIVNLIKSFMRLGYGVRSEDGKRFKKNPEVWEDFTYSAAYDHFLFSLFEDAEKSMTFLTSILPADLREQAEAQVAADEKKAKTQAALKEKTSKG